MFSECDAVIFPVFPNNLFYGSTKKCALLLLSVIIFMTLDYLKKDDAYFDIFPIYS